MYVINNIKTVNKVAYCLLVFFLEVIGIYKFYSEKTGTVILFIVFCWIFIPSIIAVVDFIIGLCKKAAASGNILF